MTKGCRALVRCWESNLVWAEEWTGVFERPEQRPVASSADKLADETRVPCVCVDTLRFPSSYPSVTVCWVLSKDFVRFTRSLQFIVHSPFGTARESIQQLLTVSSTHSPPPAKQRQVKPQNWASLRTDLVCDKWALMTDCQWQVNLWSACCDLWWV